MKIRIGNGLLLLNLLVIMLIVAIILSPSNVVRIVLGFPFVLFFPGYVLVVALFPRKEGIGGTERMALSFGLSIAVVALMGLILNYTPWGIRLESILYSMASFIFIISVITWFRQRRLAESELFGVDFQLKIPSWGTGPWDKALSLVLVVAILGALGMISYVIAAPKVGQRFTEFYILGQEDNDRSYPSELVVGQEGKVVLCIVNNEYETVTYRVEVRIGEVRNDEVEPIMLEHGEEWKKEVSFVPEVTGKEQKVEFLLYKNQEVEPCLKPLRLVINVGE